MTTTSYLMLTAGILIGFVAGTLLWELLVAGPQHRRAERRIWRLEDRARLWQSMWFLDFAEQLEDETDTHSRRAPDIRAVK